MPNSTKCPICCFIADEKTIGGDYREFDCTRCGNFKVSGSAVETLKNLTISTDLQSSLFAASLGHWVQDQQRFGLVPMLTSETLSHHKEKPHFPSIENQLANLLRVMGDRLGEPGPAHHFQTALIQFQVGCKTDQGIIGLAKHLLAIGYIEVPGDEVRDFGRVYASLTVAGWIEYEKILSESNVGRKAFIAMPFGKSDLDDVWLPNLRNAVDQTGYKLERVDDNPEPGLIDTRMKLQIKAARFLLVELTHSNHGAYWEAGMAEGLGKPVIYLRRNGDETKAHFDVEHAFRVQWDADNMELALETVKATIRNAMPDAIMADEIRNTDH